MGSWSAPERRKGEWRLRAWLYHPLHSTENGILVSTREKERGECRLGAWLYHPLHSTEEWDLGQHQTEETGEWRLGPGSTIVYTLARNRILVSTWEKERGRGKTGGLALPSRTLYRGMGSWWASERRNERVKTGAWLYHPVHCAEEWDLSQHLRKGTGEREDWGPGSTIPYTLPRNGILVSVREKERESEDWGVALPSCTLYPGTGSWWATERRNGESEVWGPGPTILYTLPRNGILVSNREKERREWSLGAWPYHPLHSNEERDLGEQQREGTERVKTGRLALPSPSL